MAVIDRKVDHVVTRLEEVENKVNQIADPMAHVSILEKGRC